MNYKLTMLMFFAGFVLSTSIAAQTTFRNPIIPGMNPDPSICRVGDDYYLVNSTFEYFPGLPISHSKDLVNWELIGYALSSASQNPLKGCDPSGGQYAATIRYDNGIFYVVGTNYGGLGTRGAFYVTAINPAGPWSEPHWVDNWGVDPSLLFANDSVYYTYASGCDGYFMQTTLNLKTGKFNKPPKKLVNGTGGSCPEGPHLYKIGEYYYIMAAEGGTGYQHMETMQRSKSPWGPFEISPINPIISHQKYPTNPIQATGHADIVETPDGWWLVCLGIRPKDGKYQHLGRETFLAPLSWHDNGWPKVEPNGMVKDEMNVPNLPQHPWEKESVRDDFDSTSLRLLWNFLRNPYASDWSLTANSGFLRLNGSALSFKQKDSPAFICRRQTAFDMVASAKIDFTPTNSNEEAGLVIRGNDSSHLDFLITQLGGKRVVMLRKYFQDKVADLNYKEIPDGDVVLRISATDLEYKFWLQPEGKKAELIGIALTKDMSTERIGGFTGVFIGMYASGNGKKNVNPADFDWFDFEEVPQIPYEWSVGETDLKNNMETPQILYATSTSFDQTKIVWSNISNETGYIIERYGVDLFDSIATTNANDTVFVDSGLSGNTIYMYRLVGKNSDGYSQSSVSASLFTLPAPGPYTGTPSQIPGKIEAENFDTGVNLISYYDTDAGNNGGKYRTDDVDIETCSDTGNGFNIGWTANGEWLMYTVDVNDTIADIEFRAASPNGGTFKLEMDGKEIGRINIPSTGGWQTWQTFTINDVKLEKGKNRKLKITYLKGNVNFNWINFVKPKTTGTSGFQNEDIRVYPNPFNGSFVLEMTLTNNEPVTAELNNSLGELVRSINLDQNSGKTTINVAHPGFYTLRVSAGNKVTVFKLLGN